MHVSAEHHHAYHLHNNVFAHGTVTNDDDDDDRVSRSKGWVQLDQINTYQHLS